MLIHFFLFFSGSWLDIQYSRDKAYHLLEICKYTKGKTNSTSTYDNSKVLKTYIIDSSFEVIALDDTMSYLINYRYLNNINHVIDGNSCTINDFCSASSRFLWVFLNTICVWLMIFQINKKELKNFQIIYEERTYGFFINLFQINSFLQQSSFITKYIVKFSLRTTNYVVQITFYGNTLGLFNKQPISTFRKMCRFSVFRYLQS